MLNESSTIHHQSSITILAVKSWRISLLSPARCQDGACVVGASWASGDLRLPDEDVTKVRYTQNGVSFSRFSSGKFWWRCVRENFNKNNQRQTDEQLMSSKIDLPRLGLLPNSPLQCPVLKPFQVSIVGGREPRGTSWSCFFSVEKKTEM